MASGMESEAETSFMTALAKNPRGAVRGSADDIQTGVDCRNLPYGNGEIDCVVLDPPYMHSPGGTAHTGHRAFERHYRNNGTGNRTRRKYHEAVLSLYEDAGAEAHRVLRDRGVLVVKCQDEVCSNRHSAKDSMRKPRACSNGPSVWTPRSPKDIWGTLLIGYRMLGNTNRGEIGEEFVRRYLRQHKIKVGNGGRTSKTDLTIESLRFEVKTASLGVTKTFQFNHVRHDRKYDYLLCLGICPRLQHMEKGRCRRAEGRNLGADGGGSGRDVQAYEEACRHASYSDAALNADSIGMERCLRERNLNRPRSL